MKDNAIRKPDRILRGVALAICVLLVEANLILLTLPLTEMFLIQVGVGRLQAITIELETLYVSVPAALLANALFILALLRRTAKRGINEVSPNLNNATSHPAIGVVAIG